MRGFSSAFIGTVLLTGAVVAWAPNVGVAAPVPCGAGTLDIIGSSDTPVTLPTFNVGQKVILTATPVGVTPTAYAWTIDGPHIKDYDERVGTAATGPISWSTTTLAAVDLTQQQVEFYWKPAPGQIHPLNAGPVARAVSVVATVAGGTCTANASFMVERNGTDTDKQAEDFYTSNHRAPTETNPLKGRVIDDHMEWHQFPATHLAGTPGRFLPWHATFLERFNQWRAEFGYPPTVPWYPGSPLPTGPDVDHTPSLRLAYNPANNRLSPWFTLVGNGTTRPGGTEQRLRDFANLTTFSNAFEFCNQSGCHGAVHCNIGVDLGGDFFSGSAPDFGSMCKASSPKDPMFFRWHGFIDVMYRNYCADKPIACAITAAPTTDVWMGDNATDIANNGTVPSPAPHWLSPDIWNRTAKHPSCLEPNSQAGTTRDCGSAADHENPVAGVDNYLYATLRNNRPNANLLVYAEVAVYIANAATGLSWPTDFTPLPQSRQFITLHLKPGETTDIGPLPWIPPNPTPSDHFCLYVRVVTVQDPLGPEGPNVDVNTGDSNSIAWRNLNIVGPVMAGLAVSNTTFIVRNIKRDPQAIGLRIEAPLELVERGQVDFALDPTLLRLLDQGRPRLEGLERVGRTFRLVRPRAVLEGLPLRSREAGSIAVSLRGRGEPVRGEVTITQVSEGKVDGGVTLQLAASPPVGTDRLPDLTVKLAGPARARPGEDIGPQLRVTVANRGGAPATGTMDGQNRGYMVDLVLSTDEQLPDRFATFSGRFAEDALLRGGRVSNTRTLQPGQSMDFRAGALIPRDTPVGMYCLGAIVDPGQQVAESIDRNNVFCHRLEVRR
jgi:hypothetical protein